MISPSFFDIIILENEGSNLMTNKQKRFFNIAREISLLSDFKRARIGAVVVDGNRIISTGCNSTKTSPVQDKYNKYRHFDDGAYCIPKVHAEIAALSPLLNNNSINWSKTELYIYREHKDGEISCAKPCEACSALIRDLGIKRIYYTDWDGSFVKEEVLK